MAVFLTLLGVILCLLMLYVFAIMPRVTDRADMDLLSTDYAKGGITDVGVPPYTLAAVSLACELGYGIELKLRLSKDGQIIVYPENDLKACGVCGRPEEYTCDELKTMRIAGSYHTIATLNEVLELTDGRSPLLLEPINTARSKLMLTRLVATLDKYGGAFAVISNDVSTLVWFKNYRTRYARGQIMSAKSKASSTSNGKKGNGSTMPSPLYRHMLLNVRTRPDFIVAERSALGSFSLRTFAMIFGCRIFVRRVRTPKEYKRCRSNGYFSVFEHFKP